MKQIERLQRNGVRRLGTPRRGFRYVDAAGKPVGRAARERIEALKVPPAWKNVFIHSSPRGAVQAMGQDRAGRWQYLYHEAHIARRDQEKFRRLVHFADALPKMRRTVAEHLARPGVGREKVLACILRILSCCFMRPGSQVYAEENGSYGIATLRPRHVTVKGDRIEFDFPGKWGKRQHREMRDRRVARIVRELLKEPGEVFKFRNGDGQWVDVRRRHINDYIKEVMGDAFSAKDFRTWAGTLICACALARAGAEETDSKSALKRKMVSAIQETAEKLGNTPAICRSSYIYPAVLKRFEKGRVIERCFDDIEELVRRRSLHESERALLRMLKE